VRSVARFFSIKELFDFFPPADVKELESIKLDLRGMTQGQVAALFQYNYPIFTDDFMFRMAPDSFESLRANYSYRREFFI
jgi:erythronate-4-phosphate dehydrogenase